MDKWTERTKWTKWTGRIVETLKLKGGPGGFFTPIG